MVPLSAVFVCLPTTSLYFLRSAWTAIYFPEERKLRARKLPLLLASSPSPRLCNTDVDSHTGGIQLFLLSRNRRSPRNLTFFLPLPFRFGNETVGERIKRDGIRANVEIETKISSKRRSGPWFVPGLFRQIEITSRKRWARIDVASQ